VTTIERTIRFATTVPDTLAAWAFITEHLPKVGPTPSVTIRPYVAVDPDDFAGWLTRFEVSVSGMTTGDE